MKYTKAYTAGYMPGMLQIVSCERGNYPLSYYFILRNFMLSVISFKFI